MILTVTPNTAVDKTYTVPDFGLDKVHRPAKTDTVAGGKGINVSRVLHTLGRQTVATGFIGGRSGSTILTGLDEEHIPHNFVRVNGESRLCIAVIDTKNKTQTEINENGPHITQCDLDRLYKLIEELLPTAEFLALCGSVSGGVPDNLYYNLINMAKAQGIKTVLDASNSQLINGIKASPYIVKPNTTELSQITKTELFTLEEILAAAKDLKYTYDIEIVTVTMGRSGALVTDGQSSWLASSPKIDFVSAVGSGDSFLAAFIDSIMRDENISEALVWGTAAGAANAATSGAGFAPKDLIYELKNKVNLTQL